MYSGCVKLKKMVTVTHSVCNHCLTFFSLGVGLCLRCGSPEIIVVYFVHQKHGMVITIKIVINTVG